MTPSSCIERAYELARTGDYATVTEIKSQLRRERYAEVDTHLYGLGLRRELMRLCEENGGRSSRARRRKA